MDLIVCVSSLLAAFSAGALWAVRPAMGTTLRAK